MKPATQFTLLRSSASLAAPRILATILGALFAFSIASCGGQIGTAPSGNTTVTIFTTGTANDQLLSFWGSLETLTLTSKSGNQVDLLPSPILPELIHLNGTIEPYLTVSIPQGVYTSAMATSYGGYGACDFLGSNGYDIDSDTFSLAVPASVNVALPSPITVTGTSMGLLLDLLVSQSAVVPANCPVSSIYSFTPAFLLTPVTISAQPTNSANGKALQLLGRIASIDTSGAGFSVARMYDQPVGQVVTWQVSSSSITRYQGVTGFSQLAVGMPVDMDAAVQDDGSLLATRVAIYDTNPSNLTEYDVHLLNTNFSLNFDGVTIQNLLDVSNMTSDGESEGSVPGHWPLWNYGNATFQTSAQLTNIASLPFTATFSALNMVAGQRILLTSHDTISQEGTGYGLATTITLIPQTINGTVSAVSSEGGFTTYTVTLAPYDLFPKFAAQSSPQVSVLTNPNTVVVYADGNTQMLNTSPIAVGSVVRFYGLVFNDNGTLRMDCAQVNDGVGE